MNTSTTHPGFARAPRWQPLPEAPARTRPAGIEGVDLELALRYAGGKMPVLVRVLRRFVATYRAGLPALLDTSGDEHAVVLRWRTACHSVRGALVMIGATRLIDAVCRLEASLDALAPPASLRAAGLQVHESLVALAAQIAAELEHRGAAEA